MLGGLCRIAKISTGLILFFLCHFCYSQNSIDDIIDEIKTLENERDPKCYATASRLEDFMFGTPLSNKTRFVKNQLQKHWVKDIWLKASRLAIKANHEKITKDEINKAVKSYFVVSKYNKLHWQLNFPNGTSVRINNNDKRQYSTIAYSLRAVLAAQQESLLELDSQLLLLEPAALNQLTHHLDLFNLSVLKLSDLSARKNNQPQVEKVVFSRIWNALLDSDNKHDNIPQQHNAISKTLQVNGQALNKTDSLSLINKIIEQKVHSYKAYNKISTQLFNRNLQIYFAKMNWPEDQDKQKHFRKIFTESMIQFSFDIYKESQNIAIQHGHDMILESDVYELIQLFIPHKINEFEDAIFFPNLPPEKRISIESYDADAFRDNSAHWRFLKYAINSSNLQVRLQPDPFALELMTENIALFGVLSLRMAGIQGKKEGALYLLASHYQQGLGEISALISANKKTNVDVSNDNKIVSSVAPQSKIKQHRKFTDITVNSGIKSMHRTSDWLNRLLRSFLEKSKNVGVVYIPPAFGGSGIAAGDFNNDGYTDILILSGNGNQMYMNEQGNIFKDMTKESGIDKWKRDRDHLPGEPRQPLIADLNNDGLQDIVITYVDDTHRVYQNMGDFHFKDVTDIANLGGKNLVGGPATVADFDNDGLLDIYITYFGHYTKGVLPSLKRYNDNGLPNQLFKNLGAFKFKNVTSGSGLDNTGWAQAVTHTDFNNDGKQDIILGNDFGNNAYYRNNGDGTFTDLAKQLGTDKASYSMSVGISDLNQDLTPDIYVSNIVVMNKDEKYVLPSENTIMKFDADKLANMRVVEANDLFLSGEDASGELTYNISHSIGRGYSSTGWSWDADFFDYDNDGDSDLYVLNGMNEFNIYTSNNPYFRDSSGQKRNIFIPVADKESNVFFENKGGILINQSKGSGIDLLGNSRSAIYLDYDRDGDLDIVVNNFNAAAVFYQNNLDSKSSRWLKIKLIGNPDKKVNRDAIGAKIILTMDNKTTIWREIHGSIGYMSVHPKIQHFGLGNAKIDKIQIIWPNGEQQTLGRLEINHEYLVYQSKGAILFSEELNK